MKKKTASLLLAVFICLLSVFPVFAEQTIPEERLLPRLVDEADLLSEDEEDFLLSELDEISERQMCDVVVATVNSLEGKTPQQFADDFFDYNGYGFGEDANGIILLISMEDRDWVISTCGFAITAFSDRQQENMSEEFLPYLSRGDYAKAFDVFAQCSNDILNSAHSGNPYDEPVFGGNEQLPAEDPESNGVRWFSLKRFGISIAVGVGLALIITWIWQNQLKTVRMQSAATDYVKSGSMRVTEHSDIFLYRNVSRRARPKDTGSGSGGSRTHTSSSGRTHGGSSGKF